MLNTTKSEELYKVALDLMPGGVNSPVRAFGAVGRNPLFIDHAKGSYVYDVDGNKFIDYVCSWGPGILGHSHPEVLEEVVKACFDGLTFGAPTGKENELAQLVKDCVPSMEMMRMVYLKGSGIGDIVQQLCVLSCFATILYGWAIHSYRKQQ